MTKSQLITIYTALINLASNKNETNYIDFIFVSHFVSSFTLSHNYTENIGFFVHLHYSVLVTEIR